MKILPLFSVGPKNQSRGKKPFSYFALISLTVISIDEENRQARFMFFFCFVFFVFVFCAKCLLGVYTQKKRKNRKLERTNTFMLTC